jgi:hypothetical protein
MLKKLPCGIQDIQKILTQNYVYVDKTPYIKKLLDGGGTHYFLARPRRFGKSLFVSTLKAVFEGKKELLADCHLGKDPTYGWETRPVVHFDFSKILASTPDDLIFGIKSAIKNIFLAYHLPFEEERSFTVSLEKLLRALSQSQTRPAVLVDEYDAPIIGNLTHPQVAKTNRDILKSFYATLKALDAHIEFTFVTGITKFSQVSLFSGPNYLTDLTFDPRYAQMLGYTEDELTANFAPHLAALGEARGQSQEALRDEIRVFYNGFRFTKNPGTVYNPYSTLRFLESQELKAYWFASGTPTFLLEQIRRHPESSGTLGGSLVTESQLSDIHNLEAIDITALMFQSGYLTVSDYSQRSQKYRLDFPNEEVRRAFVGCLAREFSSPKENERFQASYRALEKKDPLVLMEQIRRFLAGIPYPLLFDAKERTYHRLVLGFLDGLGFEIEAEKLSNRGRLDLVIFMPKITYILELKLDSSPEAALEQIKARGYLEPYREEGKAIGLVGMDFSSDDRNLRAWVWEFI